MLSMRWSYLTFLASLLILAPTLPAYAETPTVIELFTSQSCASCPGADALVHDLAGRPGIIALTQPVSYWDILGWQDTFATRETSIRLREYARHQHRDSLCTPQIIINGQKVLIGRDISRLRHELTHLATIGKSADGPEILLRHTKDKAIVLQIASAVRPPKHKATLWVMTVQRSAAVRISSGENKGKLLKYTNVVRSILNAGEWSGKAKTIPLPMTKVHISKNMALIVLLQENNYGPIRAARYYPFASIRK